MSQVVRFEVLACNGDCIGQVEVPFTGDFGADLQSAYARFDQRYPDVTYCESCRDVAVRLNETPVDGGTQLYPSEFPEEGAPGEPDGSPSTELRDSSPYPHPAFGLPGRDCSTSGGCS